MSFLLEMKDISVTFGNITANDNVNFSLKNGEVHALVGENGAGKTTLMRVLYGLYQSDGGEIFIDGKLQKYDVAGARALGIGMVHQNFMQIPELSITENIILGKPPTKNIVIDYKTADDKVKEYLDIFQLKATPGTLVKNLSVGERQRIEIIKALYAGARILILDEPTAVLTPQETQELFDIIKNLNRQGTSIVFISHKLREVAAIADRVTVMRMGRVTSHFEKDEIEESDIARAMIGKQDIDLLKNTLKSKQGKKLLSVDGLWHFDYNGMTKLEDVSFQLNQGEILGIGGVAGNGQFELVENILGELQHAKGSIVFDNIDCKGLPIAQRRKIGIAYIPEDRMTSGVALNATIDDNLICGLEGSNKFSKHGWLKEKAIEENTKKQIAAFDIRGIEPEKPVETLSGGNLQKIILAREISREPKMIIASQPTRGLDIGAINFVRSHFLEQKKKGVGILLVSADLEELMSLSDRMIIMYEGKIAGEISEIGSVTEEEIGLLMGGIFKEDSICKKD